MSIIQWFFPDTCVSCSKSGALLCPVCLATITPHEQKHTYEWGCVYSFGLYTNVVLRTALHAVKYNLLFRVLGPLSGALLSGVSAQIEAEVVLLPVPTFSATLRRRGFSPTEHLAHILGKALSLRVECGVLCRGAGRSMVGLSREERKIAAIAQYSLRNPRAIVGKSVVLIDDVLTTGATLSACAGMVRAYAREVSAVVLAYEPPGVKIITSASS